MPVRIACHIAFALGLCVNANPAQAKCAADLGSSLLRLFRDEAREFANGHEGLYTFRGGHARHEADTGAVSDSARFDNPASHLAILRRRLGPAVFARALRARDPLLALRAATEANVRGLENVREVRELRRRVDEVPLDRPLPVELLRDILAWYESRGRLATDPEAWLRPKVESGVLQRLPIPEGKLWPQVLHRLEPNSFVYKAIAVVTRPGTPVEFRLAADRSGDPFENHEQIRRELGLILPPARLAAIESQFILVNPANERSGRILVFGGQVRPVSSEAYSLKNRIAATP